MSSQESQPFLLRVRIHHWIQVWTEALAPLLVNWHMAVRRGKKARHNHVALISWLRSCPQEIWWVIIASYRRSIARTRPFSFWRNQLDDSSRVHCVINYFTSRKWVHCHASKGDWSCLHVCIIHHENLQVISEVRVNILQTSILHRRQLIVIKRRRVGDSIFLSSFLALISSSLFLNTGVTPGRRYIDQALVNSTRMWVSHRGNVELSSLRYSDPSRRLLIRHLSFKINGIPYRALWDLTLLRQRESRTARHASVLTLVPTSARLSADYFFAGMILSLLIRALLKDEKRSLTS